ADHLAPPHRRGGLVSVFYLVVYFGFAVPTIVALVAGDSLRTGVPILVLGAVALVLGVILFWAGRTLVRSGVLPHAHRVALGVPEVGGVT
ncbi:MAG: hypothetical protein M3400_09290, partial [Actinomycetota bacterium]|nr:hypothetical protein [Actinomycetota bacterium]